EEYAKIKASIEGEELVLLPEDIERIRWHFPQPAYKPAAEVSADVAGLAARDAGFAAWIKRNVRPHRVPGYRVVFVSLKAPDHVAGDCTAEQFEALADI